MIHFFRLIATLGFLGSVAFCCADILTDWERHFHVDPNNEEFADVAIDDAGNVYAIGTSFNGVDNDAIVVKYGAGGSVHWSQKFSGIGDQTGRGIAVSKDGNYLYVIYDQTLTKVNVKSLNPASGAVNWTYPSTVGFGRHVNGRMINVDDSIPPKIDFAARWAKTGENAGYSHTVISAAGAYIWGFGTFASYPDSDILDWAERPGGGTVLLIGIPNVDAPESGVEFFDGDGHYIHGYFLQYATAIGSTAANGGVVYAMGRQSATKIRIDQLDASSTLLQTGSDTYTNLTDVRIKDVVAGPSGEAYAVGYESVQFKGNEWLLARYRYSDLGRDWRTARPGTSDSEFFRKGFVDAFGSVGVLGVRGSIANDQLFMQIYDGVSGTKLGQSQLTVTAGASNLFGLAANGGGAFASVGAYQESGYKSGLVWRTSQTGLKRLSVPLKSYVGGSVIPCTATMYATEPSSRSVVLNSSSSIAPVPANIQVAANALSSTFNIVTQRTVLDRTIIVSGSCQGATRTTTFFVLAPRPSGLTFTPSEVVGGNPSTGKVNLTGLAPVGGVVVSLHSDGPEVTVPASVTVAEGAGFKTFTANTKVVAVMVVRTVSASANGVTKTKTLTVKP